MPGPDFLKRLDQYNAIAKKEAIQKQYTSDIEPFLSEVADELSKKYESEKLYPHISNFRTHILFRLGLHKKTTHRASVAVSFGTDYIERGFDLTHALGDGKQLRGIFQKKTDIIAKEIMKLKGYRIWLPNAGITKSTPIEEISLPKLKRILLKYNPREMRECYCWIKRSYEKTTLTNKQLIKVFDQERKTFGFLIDGIWGYERYFA